VARILRSQIHDVFTPTLTGVGERSHLQDHPTGQRDDAILLLMARLGLRPGEVVAMT
jgi:hypothetical protein